MTGLSIMLAATFALCGPERRVTCVVDGDTFWFQGEKVRIADINTPETHHPGCPEEEILGREATRRLVVLLNEGPFDMQRGSRDRDRYGRLLRIVSRNGQSLGEQLIAEGLAERWKGKRGNWCTAG